MTLTLLPDAEVVVRRFLFDHTDVKAITPRIATTLQTPFPSVWLWRVGGEPLHNAPYWIDQPMIQVESWGRTEAEARSLSRTVHAAIFQDLPGARVGGFVTGVRSAQGPSYQPDPNYSPAQPRMIFTFIFTVHP